MDELFYGFLILIVDIIIYRYVPKIILKLSVLILFTIISGYFAFFHHPTTPNKDVTPEITVDPTSTSEDITPEVTVNPTSTSVDQTASQFIAEYYNLLNSASTEDDFSDLYQNFFSEEMKEEFTFLENYQFWKTAKVKYKIYECSKNKVEIELEYYERSDQEFYYPGKIKYLSLPLIKRDDSWKILPGQFINEITCTNLVFEN